jgi:hypothetical protein
MLPKETLYARDVIAGQGIEGREARAHWVRCRLELAIPFDCRTAAALVLPSLRRFLLRPADCKDRHHPGVQAY